jgi:hypothetical protein
MSYVGLPNAKPVPYRMKTVRAKLELAIEPLICVFRGVLGVIREGVQFNEEFDDRKQRLQGPP